MKSSGRSGRPPLHRMPRIRFLRNGCETERCGSRGEGGRAFHRLLCAAPPEPPWPCSTKTGESESLRRNLRGPFLARAFVRAEAGKRFRGDQLAEARTRLRRVIE